MTDEELASLREEAAYYEDKNMLRVLDELEQARAERGTAWAAVRVRDETINATVKELRAQIDAAYVLLREARQSLADYAESLEGMTGEYELEADKKLRARIDALIGEK